jgi:hypothetical protein
MYLKIGVFTSENAYFDYFQLLHEGEVAKKIRNYSGFIEILCYYNRTI